MNASQQGKGPQNKFGELDIDYANCKTLADAGRAELHYIEKIFSGILARGNSSLAGTTVASGSGSGVSSRRGHGL